MAAQRIKDLPGLGPKSAVMLATIQIHTRSDLERVGPIEAYMQLKQQQDKWPSLNLLYAMIGALENRDWREVAKERFAIMASLDGYQQLKKHITDSE